MSNSGHLAKRRKRTTTNLERRKAKEDERHRRETIIRIMEEAYRCTMGLANEEFVLSIRERMLADTDFCRTLKQRMRAKQASNRHRRKHYPKPQGRVLLARSG